MMKRRMGILGLAIIFNVVLLTRCFSQEQLFVKSPQKKIKAKTTTSFVPGEIIVKYKTGVKEKVKKQLKTKFSMKSLRTSPFSGTERLKVPHGKNVSQMINIYKQDPSVEYAEPNYVVHAHYTPNDQYFSYQWNLDHPVSGGIDVIEAWDITRGDEEVVVAVLDTGVAYENRTERSFFTSTQYFKAPDFENTKFVLGFDYIHYDSHANDDVGHGTHVAGTIAQSTDNNLGVAGIAHFCKIMPVKVLDENGAGTHSQVADGIYWAVNHGAEVINISLGGPEGSETLEEACAYAYSKGVTIICSAGNDGISMIEYPAAYDKYCIAVGATRLDETRAYYSNYGGSLDLMAPGGDVTVDQNQDGYGDGILQQTFSDDPGNFGYYFYQGTSMSTPHVSGIAALLISAGVATTPDEVREVLQSTAKDLGSYGFDTQYGWGLVNAHAALNYQQQVNTPPVADPAGPYDGTEDIPVEFNGTNSSDLENDPLTYSWNFGDGHSGSGVQPTHTYTSGGTYTVSLIVNDGKINSDAVETSAIITEVNDFPVADPGGPYEGTVGKNIQLNSSGSYDPEGSALTYSWDFGNGNTSSAQNPWVTYYTTGLYTVTLSVNDGFDDSAPVSTTMEVLEEVNQPPVAKAGDYISSIVNESVAFDGSASYDSDGNIVSYDWDFGDNASATGAEVQHTYPETGQYTVILTVKDDDGASDTDQIIVTVSEPSQEIEVFSDSFEVREWNGLWSEDSQNDWYRSRQISSDGTYSAEINGRATDALLTTTPIKLQDNTNVNIVFDWFIENSLDAGEYIALDVAKDSPSQWIEVKKISGNVDPEDEWLHENIEITNISNTKYFRIRFRGKMNSFAEQANVDNVRILAW